MPQPRQRSGTTTWHSPVWLPGRRQSWPRRAEPLARTSRCPARRLPSPTPSSPWVWRGPRHRCGARYSDLGKLTVYLFGAVVGSVVCTNALCFEAERVRGALVSGNRVWRILIAKNLAMAAMITVAGDDRLPEDRHIIA